MSPKKKVAGAKAIATSPAPQVVSTAGAIVTEIELRPGERDNANLAYIERLADAWNIIQDHYVFNAIQSELPLGITANADESGNQHPFDLEAYRKALATSSATYTAGINLFWVDIQWSPTPGVPLRISAIEQMSNTTFKTPCPINDVHIAVPGPDFDPLTHKGALLRVSPEEVTGAIVLAIARDITNNEDDSVLRQWKRTVLSTTGTFKILPTASQR
jgi:hypothetical protein